MNRDWTDSGWWAAGGYCALVVAPLVVVMVAPTAGLVLGGAIAAAWLLVTAFGAGRALR